MEEETAVNRSEPCLKTRHFPADFSEKHHPAKKVLFSANAVPGRIPRAPTCLALTLELGVSVRRGAFIPDVNTDGNTAALANYQWWVCKWNKNKYYNRPISVCRCRVLSKTRRNINPPGMFSNGLCHNISIRGTILGEANNYLLLARSTYFHCRDRKMFWLAKLSETPC